MTTETGGTPQEAKMFRQPILDMNSYLPPIEGRTAKDFLRLDFNERTRPAHTFVYRDIERELRRKMLHLYPEYGNLDEVIANFAGVRSDQVIPTVGGDQAIDIISRAHIGEGLYHEKLNYFSDGLRENLEEFIDSLPEEQRQELSEGDDTVLASPTFAMLEQSANVQGAKIISPRYSGPNLEFPFDEVMREIQPGVKMVVICNPNNPTGTSVPKEQTKAIIEKAGSVNAAVLVDEAYSDFAPELSVTDLVDDYSNLYIVRSLSKNMGIANLRAGYVISQAQNIENLRKIRGPYDITGITAVAMKALRYPEVVADIEDYVAEVMTVSKPMVEEFYDEAGIDYYPSSAGFHLLEFPDRDTRDAFVNGLRERNILVRPRSDPPNTVRVSLGGRDVMGKYMDAVRDIFKLAA